MLSSFDLLSAADLWNLAAEDRWIEAACLTVGQNAIGDLGPRIRPLGDRATSPELGIVWMSDNDKHPIDR